MSLCYIEQSVALTSSVMKSRPNSKPFSSPSPPLRAWPDIITVVSWYLSAFLAHFLLQFPILAPTPSLSASASVSPSASVFVRPHSLYFLWSFAGHLSHSLYGSHGFASASQREKKKQGILGVSLISWYQSVSPPPVPLSLSSHVNWTSGVEGFAAP